MNELITKENYELMIKLMEAFKTRGYEVASEVAQQPYPIIDGYDFPLPSYLRIAYTADGMVFQYESQKQKRVVPLRYLLNKNWKEDARKREEKWQEGRSNNSLKEDANNNK